MQYTSSNTPHKYKANKQTKKNTTLEIWTLQLLKSMSINTSVLQICFEKISFVFRTQTVLEWLLILMLAFSQIN